MHCDCLSSVALARTNHSPRAAPTPFLFFRQTFECVSLQSWSDQAVLGYLWVQARRGVSIPAHLSCSSLRIIPAPSSSSLLTLSQSPVPSLLSHADFCSSPAHPPLVLSSSRPLVLSSSHSMLLSSSAPFLLSSSPSFLLSSSPPLSLLGNLSLAPLTWKCVFFRRSKR